MKSIFRILKVGLVFFILLAGLVIILFGHRDIPLDELKEKYTTNASQFVDVQGMEVHYTDEGNPLDSLPIILIHGTGSSLHTFDGWTSELKKEHRVIRMDLPAYGLTGPFPGRQYSISTYVSFMKEFLDGLEINRCIIAGNSLGGRIAWSFTAEHPDMVDRLILIDASGYPLQSKSVPIAFQLAQVPVVKNMFTFITPRFIVTKSVENVYADKSNVTDELVDRYFELTLREGNRQAFVDRFNIVADTAAHLKVKQIKQPTLVLWGAEDQLISVAVAQRFHVDLPNSTLVILENLGHVPMEENPEKSLQPVLAFLRER